MPKYITNSQQIRDLIRRHEFHVKKKLGQHFMVSSQVLERIIELAEVKAEDRVLEIGPGLGALTQHLAEKAGQVVAVEVDVSLFPLLRETLARFSNTRLVAGDILKLNLDEIMQQERPVKDGPTSPLTYKVVGNLPYYITSPIIMGILEGGYQIESLVVMIQKEVAERLVARPGTKEYGLLSVGVQYYAEVFPGGIVGRDAFWPRSEVDSALVKLIPRQEPAVKVDSQEFFFWTAKAAFGQRRKTLLNALMGAPGTQGIKREIIENTLVNIGIDPRRRGETLSLTELAEISNHLYPLIRTGR